MRARLQAFHVDGSLRDFPERLYASEQEMRRALDELLVLMTAEDAVKPVAWVRALEGDREVVRVEATNG